MCLAQGPQRSDAGEARTLRSRVKHSTTEPHVQRSLMHFSNKPENSVFIKSLGDSNSPCGQNLLFVVMVTTKTSFNKLPDQSGHAHINVLRSADFLEIDFLKNIFQ